MEETVKTAIADMILEKIQKENDIKKIPKNDMPRLAQEIRDFLIQKVSDNGGHLGSNLGTVELTMALHLSLDLPKDKIVWDVGHQAYTHKLLTGRREGFDTLRKFGGMSGFPKQKESMCDAFDTGHSSTSISAALGMVRARELKGNNNYVVAVIGDGSLTGGLAYEALNNVSRLESNLIIILNDNNMSISENVGGVNKYLNSLRTADGYRDLKTSVMNTILAIPKGDEIVKGIKRAKNSVKSLVVPGMFFEDMGITYLGPVDGHNVDALCEVLVDAKRCKGPVLIHAITKKGKGYEPAEKYPSKFHGTDPFDINSGLLKSPKTMKTYTDVFADAISKAGKEDKRVVAITAAMADGTGLSRFSKLFPERFFDVGIAEEHAVTFAAGLATEGIKPVVAVYSSFLQRAYDQIIHDVCIQKLPVVFAIDRAGIVGSDGETHQGLLDVSYMTSIPNMTVMAPKNRVELEKMLEFALSLNAPVSIRYPRGYAYDGFEDCQSPIELGKSEILHRGSEVAILALGSEVKTAETVRNTLAESGIDATLVNARFAKPLDKELLSELTKDHSLIVTLEENVMSGGFGEHVRNYYCANDIMVKTLTFAVPDCFVEHGTNELLKKKYGLDAESIVTRIKNERTT